MLMDASPESFLQCFDSVFEHVEFREIVTIFSILPDTTQHIVTVWFRMQGNYQLVVWAEKWVVIHIITWITGRSGLHMAVWLQIKVRGMSLSDGL